MTNIDENTIRALHDAGLLRSKYSDYLRLYKRTTDLMTEGKTRLEASEIAGNELGASESTVYLAFKTMQTLGK